MIRGKKPAYSGGLQEVNIYHSKYKQQQTSNTIYIFLLIPLVMKLVEVNNGLQVWWYHCTHAPLRSMSPSVCKWPEFTVASGQDGQTLHPTFWPTWGPPLSRYSHFPILRSPSWIKNVHAGCFFNDLLNTDIVRGLAHPVHGSEHTRMPPTQNFKVQPSSQMLFHELLFHEFPSCGSLHWVSLSLA